VSELKFEPALGHEHHFVDALAKALLPMMSEAFKPARSVKPITALELPWVPTQS